MTQITNWEDPLLMDKLKNDYHFYAGTGQIVNIKTIFEVIKDIVLEDINIIFEQDFITIIKENSNKKSMVHLKLETTFFEKYHISKNKYVIGVDSIKFNTIIKTAKTGETIAFCCKKNNDLTRIIIRIENSIKNTVSETILPILKFEEELSMMPKEVQYPGSIMTPSKEFQRIFKNIKMMNKKGSNKEVEIIHTEGQLVFKYTGDFSEQTVTLGESNIIPNEEGTNDAFDNEIIQGTFDLDYLLIFTKATNLNNNMLIRIQNDLPLILEYKVGVLGRLYLLLNPIENDVL